MFLFQVEANRWKRNLLEEEVQSYYVCRCILFTIPICLTFKFILQKTCGNVCYVVVMVCGMCYFHHSFLDKDAIVLTVLLRRVDGQFN